MKFLISPNGKYLCANHNPTIRADLDGNVFGGGCFKGEEKEAPEPKIKETQWGIAARTYLEKLMRGEAPLLQVAGMSEAEQYAQKLLMDLMTAKTPEIFNMGVSELEKIFSGKYDPRTSPYYQGFRAEQELMKKTGVSDIRRRSQLGGMLLSEPSARTEAGYLSEVDARTLRELGGLYESERGRMFGALPMALEYAKYPQQSQLQKLMAGMTYGALPREIEERRNLALYQQQMFPYTQQSQIAQMLMGYQPWYQPQMYWEPSTFSQIAGPIAQGVGAYYGAK